VINRLKIEFGALRDQLRATEQELAVKATNVHEAERAFCARELELAKPTNVLGERSADSQEVEIVALRMQVQTLKERLTRAAEEFGALEDRRDAERIELKAATQKLMEERGKVDTLGRRVAEIEQHLTGQTTEATIVGRRAQDLENCLVEKTRLLNESEFELEHLRSGIELACKAWAVERAIGADVRPNWNERTAIGAFSGRG